VTYTDVGGGASSFVANSKLGFWLDTSLTGAAERLWNTDADALTYQFAGENDLVSELPSHDALPCERAAGNQGKYYEGCERGKSGEFSVEPSQTCTVLAYDNVSLRRERRATGTGSAVITADTSCIGANLEACLVDSPFTCTYTVVPVGYVIVDDVLLDQNVVVTNYCAASTTVSLGESVVVAAIKTDKLEDGASYMSMASIGAMTAVFASMLF